MAYTVLEESKYLMIELVKHLIVSFVPQSRVGVGKIQFTSKVELYIRSFCWMTFIKKLETTMWETMSSCSPVCDSKWWFDSEYSNV